MTETEMGVGLFNDHPLPPSPPSPAAAMHHPAYLAPDSNVTDVLDLLRRQLRYWRRKDWIALIHGVFSEQVYRSQPSFRLYVAFPKTQPTWQRRLLIKK